jgi:hypothetical protein
MTDPNRTEIAIVLDRSGSMAAIRNDMVGGFAAFRDAQLKLPGHCVMSLYQFDDVYDVVYEELPLAQANMVLEPRGSTALYDAVGTTIVRIGERLSKKPEAERPGAVIVMIITDGHENASREYTHARVSQMIKTQETVYNWRFAFLGSAGLGDARAIGIATQSSASYSANTVGVQGMYARSAKGIGAYRNAVAQGMATQSLCIEPEDTDDSDGLLPQR